MINKLELDIKNGLNHDITSRKEKIRVSPKLFSEYSSKYFNKIKNNSITPITIDKTDLKNVLFILRSYYTLWVELKGNKISIYSKFPKSFVIITEIPNLDDDLIEKGFQKGSVLYHVSNSYNTCNRLRGVPLWYEMNTNNEGLTPCLQVNYEFIQPIY